MKVYQQTSKSTSSAVQKRTAAEQRRQWPWMPGPSNDLDRQRQEFLLNCLLDPKITSEPSFGIIWQPTCVWAQGPSIKPYAHIFDRSVNGRWIVEVVDDIDGNGNSGWHFSRV